MFFIKLSNENTVLVILGVGRPVLQKNFLQKTAGFFRCNKNMDFVNKIEINFTVCFI